MSKFLIEMIFSKAGDRHGRQVNDRASSAIFTGCMSDTGRAKPAPDRGGPLVVGVDELSRRGTEICRSVRYSELSAWTVQPVPTLP